MAATRPNIPGTGTQCVMFCWCFLTDSARFVCPFQRITCTMILLDNSSILMRLVFFSPSGELQLIVVHSRLMKPSSFMLSRSRPRITYNPYPVPAPLEVLDLLRTPMVCAVVSGSGTPPGRSFRASLKLLQFTWTPTNHQFCSPVPVSSYLYGLPTHKLAMHLGSLAPIRVYHHRSLTTQVHSHTFQGIPTLSRTTNLERSKRSSPLIQTSPHSSLITTSGKQTGQSPGMIVIHCKP